ncbi:MAG: hypothetical protein ABI064_06160, partial [Acidobacteriaceae bacterium]
LLPVRTGLRRMQHKTPWSRLIHRLPSLHAYRKIPERIADSHEHSTATSATESSIACAAEDAIQNATCRLARARSQVRS